MTAADRRNGGRVAVCLRAAAAVSALMLALTAAAPMAQTPSGFPAEVEKYLSGVVRPTADERRRLLAGTAVAKLLSADGTEEVGVFGAVWINAPIQRYVERLMEIERFERGAGFKMTKRISMPPVPGDFAALRLPDEDVDDLRSCRVDDCDVKLSANALQRFRNEIDWKAGDPQPAVNALMRQIAFDYVTGYLAGGNERLAVYRDRGRPTSVAGEFRDMVERMPELTAYAPDLRRYLIEFPAVTMPNATSFLYWQETEFGLKPTIRISHLTIRQTATDTVVASKMLYATHYFWTGLELRALVPDPARGAGFWFITTSRSRSDGLSGFIGSFVRRRVRSEVLKGAMGALRTTKEKLEQPAAAR